MTGPQNPFTISVGSNTSSRLSALARASARMRAPASQRLTPSKLRYLQLRRPPSPSALPNRRNCSGDHVTFAQPLITNWWPKTNWVTLSAILRKKSRYFSITISTSLLLVKVTSSERKSRAMSSGWMGGRRRELSPEHSSIQSCRGEILAYSMPRAEASPSRPCAVRTANPGCLVNLTVSVWGTCSPGTVSSTATNRDSHLPIPDTASSKRHHPDLW
mmetsp:Transcript_25442/g.75945  ORF Transcript_25442/g.75945 Transcript_25442/m.75945 type:complete len:217 (+) Transcript_25442:186-836(+)